MKKLMDILIELLACVFFLVLIGTLIAGVGFCLKLGWEL